MKTLIERLLEAGYPKDQMFHHYSDLYIFASPLTKLVINKWCEDNRHHKHLFVSTFHDQITGRLMYDVAFQYYDMEAKL